MIGIDIIRIDRIKDIAGKERIFNQTEIAYADKFKNSLEKYAGFFCAKEALFKAIGEVNQKDVVYNEICVDHHQNGAPYFTFNGALKEKMKCKECELSISHDGEYATAICIIKEKI